MIGLPPSFGAVNDTEICAFPGVTDGCAGAEGPVLGTTGLEAADAGPSPFAFVPVTVHVYDFPFVSPLTTMGDVVPDSDPGVPPFGDVHVAA